MVNAFFGENITVKANLTRRRRPHNSRERGIKNPLHPSIPFIGYLLFISKDKVKMYALNLFNSLEQPGSTHAAPNRWWGVIALSVSVFSLMSFLPPLQRLALYPPSFNATLLYGKCRSSDEKIVRELLQSGKIPLIL